MIFWRVLPSICNSVQLSQMQPVHSSRDNAEIWLENNYLFGNWFRVFSGTFLSNRRWLFARLRWMAWALVNQENPTFLSLFSFTVHFVSKFFIQIVGKKNPIVQHFSGISLFFLYFERLFQLYRIFCTSEHYVHFCRREFLNRLNRKECCGL